MNTFVKKSDIEGLGLFASDDIKEGEFEIFSLPVHTGEITGDRFFVFDSVYDLRLSNLQYMNHSDTPNIDYIEIEGKIKILALRDIEKGEELLIDYGWDEEKKNSVFGVMVN